MGVARAARAVARTPIYRCDVAGCPRADVGAAPFETAGALGGHKRRRHGIVSIAHYKKRPQGGTHYCPFPGCEALQPYVKAGGLGTHLRVVHGVTSENPESVKRRLRRASTNPIIKLHDKLPPSPVTTTHVPKHGRTALSSTQLEYLRRRTLYVLNGTWARELDMPPESLRDALIRLCASNFASVEEIRRARAR